jgi:hypothetical protein
MILDIGDAGGHGAILSAIKRFQPHPQFRTEVFL